VALNLFNQALKIDPGFIDALDGKGSFYAYSGKYDSALYYYEEIDKIEPENLASVGGKGMTYLFKGNADSALKYWQNAKNRDPENPWMYLGLGQTYNYLKNEPAKGLFYFHKALDLGGASQPEINMHTAIGYFHIGNYIKALEFINSAIAQKPECKLFLMYDYVLFAQGNFNGALHYIDSTCNLNPCEQSCDIMRFYIYTTLKDFVKAEKFYHKAIDAGYKMNANDNIYLAFLYNQTGRRTESFRILKNSIRLDESLEETSNLRISAKNVRIAASYSIMGDTKKALKYLPRSGYFELFELYVNRGTINIKSFPGFENLKNDQEFKAIVKGTENQGVAVR
jgi:tetratricopeptide (TPR) repeat protein